MVLLIHLIYISRGITNNILLVRKYISSISRSRGAVEVINHRKARYDRAEPRASEATYEEYIRPKSQQRRGA
jgi:hypothetical protein